MIQMSLLGAPPPPKKYIYTPSSMKRVLEQERVIGKNEVDSLIVFNLFYLSNSFLKSNFSSKFLPQARPK